MLQEELNENQEAAAENAATPEPVAAAPQVVEAVTEEEEEVEIPLVDPEALVVTGAAHDDFDWGRSKRGQVSYSDADRATMLNNYDVTMKGIAAGTVARGRISSIVGADVVLDFGHKSDGLVPVSDCRDLELKVGEYVEVYVESTEDGKGNLVLSRRKAKLLRAWEALVDSFANGTVISGIVVNKTKGGLIVDVGGLETFLPGSQIDIKPIVDYDQYVGKRMEFKVVKINETIKNAVVSHKALIESDIAEQRETILGGLEKGQVLEGVVKNVTDFGAFLDLGGVDGLLYITDISWGRITHPNEVLSLNQKINVVVLDFDENKKRISLGLKQLTPHPWEVLHETVHEGSTVKGKIVNIEDYGAFLEIMPGVEGLIHVSEISWANAPINAREFFKMNQEMEARVVTIDRSQRKMSLSVKQLTNDPWSEVAEKLPIGSKHSGEVKNITPYGVFVDLGNGMGGMVHISDLSWTKRYTHPSEFTKVGSFVDVVILDIDTDTRKISLGHKQLENDPWDNFDAVFTSGSTHEGTVLRKDDRGAIFGLPHGLEAFSPIKHLRKEDGSNAEVGDVLSVKIIEFNKDDRRVLVSHARFVDDQRRASDEGNRKVKDAENAETRASVKSTQDKVEKDTLGDLSALAQLRDQLDKE
ncbi:MAG: hypothetical protein RL757_1263 [Bacteroidota bacterium]|jgi:small subunit ribosomal protein S1